MTNGDIFEHYLSNKEHYEESIDLYRKSRDHLMSRHPDLKDDIKQHYKEICRYIIADGMTKTLACSYEDCLIVLENLEF